MTPAEILDAAANLLDERGWFACGLRPRREGCDRMPGNCAITAVAGVGRENAEETVEALRLLCQVIGLAPKRHTDIFQMTVEWNNSYDRTRTDVTSALRAAAVLWRAGNETRDSVNHNRENECNCKKVMV